MSATGLVLRVLQGLGYVYGLGLRVLEGFGYFKLEGT